MNILDRYPIPVITDLTAGLAGEVIFSRIDIVRGCNQILDTEADIPKRAVKTHISLRIFEDTAWTQQRSTNLSARHRCGL